MVKYKTGDVIVSCQPFVHVLDEKERGRRCDFCFKEL